MGRRTHAVDGCAAVGPPGRGEARARGRHRLPGQIACRRDKDQGARWMNEEEIRLRA